MKRLLIGLLFFISCCVIAPILGIVTNNPSNINSDFSGYAFLYYYIFLFLFTSIIISNELPINSIERRLLLFLPIFFSVSLISVLLLVTKTDYWNNVLPMNNTDTIGEYASYYLLTAIQFVPLIISGKYWRGMTKTVITCWLISLFLYIADDYLTYLKIENIVQNVAIFQDMHYKVFISNIRVHAVFYLLFFSLGELKRLRT